jgi:hypothetical protein
VAGVGRALEALAAELVEGPHRLLHLLRALDVVGAGEQVIPALVPGVTISSDRAYYSSPRRSEMEDRRDSYSLVACLRCLVRRQPAPQLLSAPEQERASDHLDPSFTQDNFYEVILGEAEVRSFEDR